MDIHQTTPFLMVNIARFLLTTRAKRGKIYTLILALAMALATAFLFFEFRAPIAEADLLLIYQEATPGLVIFQGNALVSTASPSFEEIKTLRKIKVVVTAYSSSPWETDGNPYITASGNWVGEGIVANNMLPFGTKVRIPEVFGDKVFVVQDRMHWRKGNYHVDIWFPSYWEALNFGAKRTYIEVLEG